MTTIQSEVKEDPIFSFKNFFRPTAKNVLIWGNGIKVGCASLIAFATTVVSTNVTVGVILILAGLVGGFIADSVISFTREKPVDTLVQAVVDVKNEDNGKDN